ncbi:putative ribosomal N-acetyltransferase YdaF [Posidoniimonas corsicana]|uniref:Putative ribosomal N-acetyltransferase YdaF n=1 Tax=Posidoniimonas corsicana TaxID=1938618 RepID=A0A5C5V2I0_9BACT|nr:putative ribosomal N-acetyltransferase YdaF [Posidoniimonas corsicana]
MNRRPDTPVVTLQKPALRHEAPFLQAVRRSRTLHRGFASPPASSDAYRQYLKSLRRENRLGFLVTLEDAGELVGVVNVNEIVRGVFQSAYLGYYAFVPHAGQGLMRQGLRRVIGRCFRDEKLHRLEANIQPENERSLALVAALGFAKEGYSPRYLKIGGKWRDHERWAIRSEQWR